MQNIRALLGIAAIAAASIAGINVAQVVHAASGTTGTCPCGSGNPHVPDPDTGITPKGTSYSYTPLEHPAFNPAHPNVILG